MSYAGSRFSALPKIDNLYRDNRKNQQKRKKLSVCQQISNQKKKEISK